MDTQKQPAEDSIVDFIDDDEYYRVRKYKEQVEKGTLAIYIFAALALLGFAFFIMQEYERSDWLIITIGLIFIIIYFCLGAYSKYKPFTSFIVMLSLVGLFFLTDLILVSNISLGGLVVKIVFVVYLSMQLEAAKKVQAYESKAKK
jgi:membrane-bound ClpP family serine protease